WSSHGRTVLSPPEKRLEQNLQESGRIRKVFESADLFGIDRLNARVADAEFLSGGLDNHFGLQVVSFRVERKMAEHLNPICSKAGLRIKDAPAAQERDEECGGQVSDAPQ